jgi:hypothetical protein
MRLAGRFPSIRTRVSVWIGLAVFVGWMLLRILPKKQRTYVTGGIREANHRLVLELLGAVAIRLVQRYFKSWRSTLIVKLKVIQDIAANASKPQAGFIATTIGVVLALFGASGVFGQLQDALNTIWGVKPKPGGGLMGFIGNCLKRT